MKTKIDIQSEVTNAIIDNNFNGMFEVAMRVGKTKILIDALKSFNKNKILWITDSEDQRDNAIPSEFRKWGGNLSKVKVMCYGSTKKINEKYDLIILDECQKLTDASLRNIIGHYDHLLACSGTIPNKRSKLELYKSLGLKMIYTLSVDQAVEYQIIAPYRIIVWTHTLDSVNKNIKIEYKNKYTNKISTFYNTELQRYQYLSERISVLKDTGRDTFFMNIRRMNFIGHLPTKERMVLEYLYENQDKKILIFCSDIKQAERITPLSYHSKTDDACLNAFLRNEINHLSVVRMVDTGKTFPHIDEVIILLTNSSNVQTVQRIGRSLMYRDNYVAKIILLCAVDTVEKTWIEKALEKLDNSKITYI